MARRALGGRFFVALSLIHVPHGICRRRLDDRALGLIFSELGMTDKSSTGNSCRGILDS